MNNQEAGLGKEQFNISPEDYKTAIAVGIDPDFAIKIDRDIEERRKIAEKLGLREEDVTADVIRRAIRDKWNSMQAGKDQQVN